MTNLKLLGVLLLLALIGGLTLVTSSSSSATPGLTSPGHAAPSINAQQRDLIRALHGAYRAAVAELDWSVGENGHAPETVEQARDLRMALEAEIREVLERGNDKGTSSGARVRPYSGQTRPGSSESKSLTLYL